jgi:hypothetical protein
MFLLSRQRCLVIAVVGTDSEPDQSIPFLSQFGRGRGMGKKAELFNVFP